MGENSKISNILVIDNEKSSIHYYKNDIDSSVLPKIIDEEIFLNMFDEEHESIYSIDCSRIIKLIKKDGTEITLNDFYKSGKNLNDILFIKLTNDSFEKLDTEILIYADVHAMVLDELTHSLFFEPVDYSYEKYRNLTKEEIDHSSKDFDGYANCEKLIKIRDNTFLSVMKCRAKHINDEAGNVYQGYLPAIVQMNWIVAYMPVINYIMGGKVIVRNSPIETLKTRWLTSTTIDETSYAWVEDTEKRNMTLLDCYYYNGMVFPIFKKLPK